MDTPITYRRFDDIDGQREDVYQMARDAISKMRPLSNATHQLEIADVDYDDDYSPTIAEEKEAIMKRKSLQRKLMGTLRLKDTAGNVVEERRLTLANVPHVNSRGMFIRDGVPYVIRNQLRLRPGVYTRTQKSGGTESHFNVKPGTGRGFRIEMEPESGVFKMRVDQSTTKLYPVLRALGVQDDDMRKAWGDELFQKNYREKSGRDDLDLGKLVRKFTKGDVDIPADQLPKVLSEAFNRAEVDEDTSELTLGERIRNLTPAVLLKATQKQLRIAQGLDKPDNRDSQAYQSFHAAQDLIAERLQRDATGAARKAFWKASKLGSLKNLPPGFLNDNVSSLFQGSGLAMGVEDINPVEVFDIRQAVTRLGEGGISNESVSREARNVQGSYLGVIDANRAPDSSNIGVDLRLTDAAERGSDNQLYTTVRNLKTGQLEKLSARTLSTKAVTFPGEMASETKRVPTVKGDSIVYVPKDQVEYEIVNPDDMMSRASRLIPFPEGIKGQRLAMGSRMTAQAVPLTEPESPFVQAGNADGSSLHQSMGRDLGAKFAPGDGIVTKVTPDFIEMTGNDGKRHRVDLYNHYPMARKTFLHNDAVVKPGDVVKSGQPLARSNYTDKSGAFAIGRNMRVGYMVAEGDTIEDAFVLSESAAKKLGAQAMYKADLDLEGLQSTDKASYNAIYAGKYTPAQLDTIDDDGVVKVGTQVQTGDPLVLAVGKKDPAAIGALVKSPKSAVSDKAQVWEHKAPGIVTDVQRTKTGIRVMVKSYDIADVGDKVSGRYGNKGVISGQIRPDDQMPIAEDGKPLEVIMNANGVVSRVNPAALAESLLGKIVERTGRAPYVVKSFSTPEGIADFALNEAAKHGINELETVTDPRDGRKIPNVFVGNSYLMRLHHKAEGKLSARDQGSYTVDDTPARGGSEGSKRIGLLDANVLIAAGATEFLKDAKLARGQRNDDYWRQVRHGETPQLPSGSFADEQFKSMLKAAGVNVRSEGSKEQLRPLLDSDVDRMASHEIENPETFEFDTMNPIKGGLFDVGMTGGAGGNRFTKITLPTKVPHPLFIDPIKRILGKSGKELDALLTGKEEVDGLTGPEAVEKLLSEVNIDREMELSKQTIRTGAASKRDAAVKRLHYLAGLKKMGVQPQELMVSKIAVIPPRYRPVVRGKNTDMIHDLNYLYKDLFEAKKNYEEAKKTFGEAGDEYATLMQAVQAVSGTENPVNPKTAEQGVKGILRYAIGLGDSPKCYDSETEILTRDGWVPFPQYVDPSIPVATLNPLTSTFEWQTPSEIIHAPYVGPMVKTSSLRLDIVVTPNHKHWIAFRGRKLDAPFSKFEKVDAAKLLYGHDRAIMKTAAANWEGNTPHYSVAGVQPGHLEFAELVGLWVAGGWLHKDGYTAYWCQTHANLSNVEYIDSLFKASSIPFSRAVYQQKAVTPDGVHRDSTIVYWSVNDRSFVSWLRDNCGSKSHNKFLSKEILGWSKPDLEKLVSGYLLGDGSRRSNPAVKRSVSKRTHQSRSSFTDVYASYSTSSHRLVDCLSEVFIKIGLTPGAGAKYPPRKEGWHALWDVGIIGRDFAAVDDNVKNEWVDYSGLVHCVTVPNGLIFVRRNNKIVVSGNSAAYQRKVIGTAVDTVGRSVITANRNLGMDEIGLPENMAWKIFRPYIIRRLVTNGSPPAEAIQAVEDRTPAASAMLDEELKARPVVYNRAPALHRYAYQGAWARRVKGDAIHVPYHTLKSTGGDFDGDAENIHVPSSAEAIEDVKEKLMPSKNLFFTGSFETHYEPTQDYTVGLYLAGKMDPKQKPVTFANAQEAKAAYARGLINARTPIRILA